jgi:hypothetical protein
MEARMEVESSSLVLGLVTQWLRKPCGDKEVMTMGMMYRGLSDGIGPASP